MDSDEVMDLEELREVDVGKRPRSSKPPGEFTPYKISLDQPLADEFEMFMKEEGITTITEAFRMIMRGWVKGRKDERERKGGRDGV